MSKFIYFFLFLFFLFFSTPIFAQETSSKRLSFSVYAAPTFSVARSEKQVTPAMTFISRNSEEIRFRKDERDVFFKFENKFGASLGANLHLNLNKYFQLESGLGFQFSRYFGALDFGPVRTIFDGEIIAISTTPTVTEIENTPFNCDEFIDNTTEKAHNFQQGVHHQLLYLGIPLQLNLRLYEGKFAIYAGGLFSTPIFSQVPSLRPTTDRTTTDDGSGQMHTTCTFDLKIVRDRRGFRFQKTNLALYGGLRYQIGNRWGMDLHYQQVLNPITVEEFYPSDGAIQLSSFALKLRYFLSPN